MSTNDKLAIELKTKIINELFEDIGKDKCTLDVILDCKDDVHKNISKLSCDFIDKCNYELNKERNSGHVLFFRKYVYEKVLNTFLKEKYGISNIGMMLLEGNIQKAQSERQKKEKEKQLAKERLEKRILSEVSNLQWTKEPRIGLVKFSATDKDRNTITVRISYNVKKKTVYENCILKINGATVKSEKYNDKEIVKKITDTNPKVLKPEHITIVRNQNKSPKMNAEKNAVKHTDIVEKDKSTNEQKINVSSAMAHTLDKYKNLSHGNPETIDVLRHLSAKYGIKMKKLAPIIVKCREKCPCCYDDVMCSKTNKVCNPGIQDKCDFYRAFNIAVEKEKKTIIKASENKSLMPTYKQNTEDYIQGNRQSIGIKDFVVRCNVFACVHKCHKIDNIDAMIEIDERDKRRQVNISAGYCRQCGTYFIMESTYLNLKKKGLILCRVSDEKTYKSSMSVNGMQLAQQSVLMQYGYNVSQTEGLTQKERRKILAVIIDNNIMSKSEIISYLDFFISQRAGRSNMEIAISKWENDRDFVAVYRSGEYSKFGVNAIYRK